MSQLTTLLAGPVAQAIGWALVHFLWQATLVAAALAVAVRLLEGSRAEVRYAVSVGALLLTLALPLATAIQVHEAASTPVAASGETVAAPIVTFAPSGEVVTRAPLATTARLQITRWIPVLVGFWVLGVIVLSLRLSLHWLRVRSLIRDASSPVAERWEAIASSLANRLGMRRVVRIAESALVDVPTVVGWLRPVILMPISALSGLTPQQIETILAHELAHVRRQDYIVNLLQTAIETLLFYHPAVWWISRQIRIEREHCCDDLAVEVCGDPVTYARALTILEQMRARLPETAVASNGGSLLTRIRRLVGRPEPQEDWSLPTASGLALAAIALALLLAVTPFASAEKSQNENAKKQDNRSDTHLTVTGPADEVDLVRIDPDIELDVSGMMPELPEIPEVPEIPDPPELEWPALPASAVDGLAVPLPPDAPAPVIAPLPPLSPIEPAIAEIRVVEPALRSALATALTIAPSDDGDDEPYDPDNLSVDDLIRLRGWGVTPEFIDAVHKLGYPNASLRAIARLRNVGADPDWIRDMRAIFGNDVTIESLVRLRGVGVTPEYVAQMKKAGMSLDVGDAIRLRGVGVTPDYIDKMRALGAHDADEMVRLRGVGVTTGYAADMKRLFGRALTADELVRLRGIGVTTEYVDAMRKLGAIGVDVMIRLRGVGVTTEYAAEMKKLLGREMDAASLIRLRGVGVTTEYANAMKGVGLDSLQADDLVRLRGIGVTPDYVRELKAAGLTNLTAHDLVRLKGNGIDASFIREMKTSKN